MPEGFPPAKSAVLRRAAPGLVHTLGLPLLTVALLGLTIPIFSANAYVLDILISAFLFAGLASAWNIIGGFGGQFSLGHGVFFAAGAYTVAQLYLRAGISPWLGLVAGAAVGTAIAMLVSWPTFRLRGPFFAIATMAINEVGLVVVNTLDGVTGGPQGLMIPFRPSLGAMIFAERWQYAVLLLGFMGVAVVASALVRRGRLGHYLLAVRANEDAARAAGVDVFRSKLSGMAVSAALTSVGGGLFAMYVRVLDPPALFALPEIGVKFALIALIGGIGTVLGPVLGALAIVPLESALRATLSDAVPGGHLIVLGAVLVLAARFFRRGIVGTVSAWYRKWRLA